MATLAKVSKFFNNVNLSATDKLFVGIDVHKKTYHVAFFLNNAPAIDFVMPADKQQLSAKLTAVKIAIEQIVYESGPTGYGLARHLHKQSLPVSVVATSKIPAAPGIHDKTDKIDSKKLAFYAAKGLLQPITVPTVKQEADRQLFRMRHRQVRNLARVNTQIKSFLLMHDLPEPPKLSYWSKAVVQELKDFSLPTTLRLSLDELLSDFHYYDSRVKQINKEIAEHLDKGKLAQRMQLLKTHPGVGPVVACQYATELYHYRNFPSTREIFKYLGLCPKVDQSGQRCTVGSINKASNGRLRSNLIQAAWRWIAVDIEAKKTYNRLLKNNGGIAQKAITAMARKLAGHLWAMLMKNEVYTSPK